MHKNSQHPSMYEKELTQERLETISGTILLALCDLNRDTNNKYRTNYLVGTVTFNHVQKALEDFCGTRKDLDLHACKIDGVIYLTINRVAMRVIVDDPASPKKLKKVLGTLSKIWGSLQRKLPLSFEEEEQAVYRWVFMIKRDPAGINEPQISLSGFDQWDNQVTEWFYKPAKDLVGPPAPDSDDVVVKAKDISQTKAIKK